MEPFQTIRSIATPLDKINVDTDQIVPKQFLKLVQKTGFGKYLFHDWRYDKDNNSRKDFVLNDPKYNGSRILLTRDNFGCGSSREHAAWALSDYGFTVIISTSFADIFFNNCFKNGILPIKLEAEKVEMLFKNSREVEVNLEQQTIKTDGMTIKFDIEDYRKKTLLEGLDEIKTTLQFEDKILQYEKNQRLYNNVV